MHTNSFSKIIPKLLAALAVAGVFLIAFLSFQKDFVAQKTISEYFDQLNSQAVVMSDEKISDQELDDLKKCGEDFKCFLNYYYNFNLNNSLQRTFSNLSLLLLDHPEYTDYCHQITHGIGKSEYVKEKGDLGAALELFNTGRYFNNISTCGSGYFHGLVQEAVKDIKDKDELVKTFNNICYEKTMKDVAGSDCIHGLGHAAYLQTDYNLEDSIYICNNTTKSEYDRFNCYTGVFMEATIDLPGDMLIARLPGVKLDYVYCDQVTDSLEKNACYYEVSMQLRNMVKDKNDYSLMMLECKKIDDPIYRVACVKNVSVRSIIDTGNRELSKMCIQTGLKANERILCVAAYAHRLALSITEKKNEDYYKITNDICDNLSISEQAKCKDQILNHAQDLYLVSERNLGL